jgi:hypothetical protein
MSESYLRRFEESLLVSNVQGAAVTQDTRVINAWGIVIAEKTVWVANNGTGYVTSYDFNGNIKPYSFLCPPAARWVDTQTFAPPTGLVENTTTTFPITNGSVTRGSFLLACTSHGTVCAWNPYVNSSSAITVIDNSNIDATYKGITIANNLIYLANFVTNTIEVYNSNYVRLFQQVSHHITLFTLMD